jgi:hypothetical protein
MEVIVEALGTKKRNCVINIPEALIVSVRRQDGYEPSIGEIYVALRLGLDSLKGIKSATK